MKKIAFAFILCLILKLLLLGQGVLSGGTVAGLDEEILSLKEENLKLEAEIAQNLSYHHIAQKAAESGFVSLSELAKKDSSVALRP